MLTEPDITVTLTAEEGKLIGMLMVFAVNLGVPDQGQKLMMADIMGKFAAAARSAKTEVITTE